MTGESLQQKRSGSFKNVTHRRSSCNHVGRKNSHGEGGKRTERMVLLKQLEAPMGISENSNHPTLSCLRQGQACFSQELFFTYSYTLNCPFELCQVFTLSVLSPFPTRLICSTPSHPGSVFSSFFLLLPPQEKKTNK